MCILGYFKVFNVSHVHAQNNPTTVLADDARFGLAARCVGLLSTFQFFLLVFNGFHLGLVDVGERFPLPPVVVQTGEHGGDFRVEA